MYCQECGAQIRSHAKFCNRCGTEVRQRFGRENDRTGDFTPLPPPPPLRPAKESNPKANPKPPAVPPPTDRQPLSRHAWSGAEEAIVMPAISRKPEDKKSEDPNLADRKSPDNRPLDKRTTERSLPGSAPLPADTAERMKVRFDLMKPDTSDAEHVPNTGQINSAGDPITPARSAIAPVQSAQPPRQDPNMAPFFTQVVTTVPNRQHSRVILIVPLLLLVAVLLLVLAYIVNK